MEIRIRGAREHNLHDVDVDLGDGLTVITGVSGSGKTSLAFDVLYHEARRRFIEIYDLGGRHRPAPAEVDSITGLGPAVAVGQNLLNRNPNSTLATASGLHPLLRLLYARFGQRHCARCGAVLRLSTMDEIVERLAQAAAAGPTTAWAPLLRGARGSHRTLLALLAAELGAEDLRVDGAPWDGTPLDAGAAHDLDVCLAELDAAASPAGIRAIVERAAALGAVAVAAEATTVGTGAADGRAADGRAADGRAADGGQTWTWAPLCVRCGAPFSPLRPLHLHTPCPHCRGAGCEHCGGTGLLPEAAAVRWAGLRLPDLLALSAGAARALFASAAALLPPSAARLRDEIDRRLEALEAVGLGYVALDRPAPTLSRGEAQRVRLAVALTSRLEDILHVLDEPTVGQHPADVARLLPALRRLPGPVVYVEHDRLAAAEADRAVDLGPGAGREGGRLLYSGTPAGLWAADTPTGRYFSLRRQVARPAPRPAPEAFLTVRGADLRNLAGIDVPIPLARLTAVSGVSGSGKSTLAMDVLAASLAAGRPQGCRALEGPPLRAVPVDQSPIGRNPRSNPATYTKLADIIRDGYAAATGLTPSHFTFNRDEGACPACQGLGAEEVQMRYLPSTWVTCGACGGQRFSEEVLAARAGLGGERLSIADLYERPVSEMAALLADLPLKPADRRRAERIVQALLDVGLGYLALGQPSTTLSGGEAQRVKLARHLGQRSLAGQLLLLDEPTTGLHPQDVAGLLAVLDRLVREGATVVVVEHNTDLIRAADWAIDLGPGAGPEGGRLLYAGPPAGLAEAADSLTGRALREEAALRPRTAAGRHAPARAAAIEIRGARANNLRNVDVTLPKGALTVVTGVSGSGKSSLVGDVLETEARRRFLETLSMYERQGTREGHEAPVDRLSGLGVTLALGSERPLFERRATVGSAAELTQRLAVLLSAAGERACPVCGTPMLRETEWHCPGCGTAAPIAAPRFFVPTLYGAACRICHGVGTLQVPRPEKLIIHPERPLCAGAMYSPGFFPQGYLGQPNNGGYDLVQALAARYGFDPMATPWREMAPAAQQAFLYGDPEPMEVTYHGRSGRVHTHTSTFPGFYGWVRDWDPAGTYTATETCPDCDGGCLRPEYLAVTLGGLNAHALNGLPLAHLAAHLEAFAPPGAAPATWAALGTARRRLRFLSQVGLGYLHLDRIAATLSAGEAQRVRLAGLLGSELTALTVLLDEPSRGLHPAEVDALGAALGELRDAGNTVIVIEHDPELIRAADYLLEMGPGAGTAGGRVTAAGRPAEVLRGDTITARWLRGERRPPLRRPCTAPRAWMIIRGARGNNLRGQPVRLPLGRVTGVCGRSGSGKSTLIIDTLGRALAPVLHTTSTAREPWEPLPYEAIEGAPPRAVVVDQARAAAASPASYLDLLPPLYDLYAAGEDARALGLDAQAVGRRCAACKGSGVETLDMGFLPAVHDVCEVCGGSGYAPEAAAVRWDGLTLAELLALTVDEAYPHLRGMERLAAPLAAAREVGLGYLALRQPGRALSGGEAQRLKIAAELCRPARQDTLYILDEPTVGQHLEDVARLIGALYRLADAGHTVVAVEHHPHLLAACDWLVELGPGGGPDGGAVIAEGPPAELAAGDTPMAPYLRAVLWPGDGAARLGQGTAPENGGAR